MGCSLPGSSVHGISQARILEWVAISFSVRSSWPRDWTQVSHIAGWFFTIWAHAHSRTMLKKQNKTKHKKLLSDKKTKNRSPGSRKIPEKLRRESSLGKWSICFAYELLYLLLFCIFMNPTLRSIPQMLRTKLEERLLLRSKTTHWVMHMCDWSEKHCGHWHFTPQKGIEVVIWTQLGQLLAKNKMINIIYGI